MSHYAERAEAYASGSAKTCGKGVTARRGVRRRTGATLACVSETLSMFRKIISVWFVFLTLAPFTAPFPTCDLKVFLTERAPVPGHGAPQTTSLADASLSQALPLFRPSGRVRFVALPESKTASGAPARSAVTLIHWRRPVGASSLPIELTILRI